MRNCPERPNEWDDCFFLQSPWIFSQVNGNLKMSFGLLIAAVNIEWRFSMKCIFLLLVLACISVHAFSSGKSADSTKRSPLSVSTEYSFENAEKYVQANDFEKAVWIFINLYPVDSVHVISCMKAISKNFENTRAAIQKSFLINSFTDPQLTNFEKGQIVVNTDMVNKKGKWADDLIRALDEQK